MTLEAQCTANENAAKQVMIPIYGIATDATSDVEGKVFPGPLIWHQTHQSFVESLEAGGNQRLNQALRNIGASASPGSGVTYLRVGGAHGAGVGGEALATLEPISARQRLIYRCSQSMLAGKEKRGKGGIRVSTNAAVAPGESEKKIRRRGLTPASDCPAMFVLAMRGKSSRKQKCPCCGELISFSHDAADDPTPFPVSAAGSFCPFAAQGHVLKSGFRCVKVVTCHKGHWSRPPALHQRVAAATADSMAAMHHGMGVPSGALASIFADSTGGRLSTDQTNKVIHRASVNAGRVDTGVSGLLEALEARGDVVYVVKYRTVRAAFVAADDSVALDDQSLNVTYELYLPAHTPPRSPTRWDVTEAFQKSGMSGWSAVEYFCSGLLPGAVDGVKPLTAYLVDDGFVLNAAGVYWQSSTQALETLRAPFVVIGDSTCKTSSSVMELGVFMVKLNTGGSCQSAHFLLNGLTRASYRFAFDARRALSPKSVNTATELRLIDGDPHLEKECAADSELSGFGDIGWATCFFHAVCIKLMKMITRQGLDKGEANVARDLKDKILAVFRGCETEPELMVAHRALIDAIDAGKVPHGPHRRRLMQRDALGGATKARRTEGPAKRKRKRQSGTKYEVQGFVGWAEGVAEPSVIVKWLRFADTTVEPVSALIQDLGVVVFAAHRRAAGMLQTPDTWQGNPDSTQLSAADLCDDDDDAFIVEKFEKVSDDGAVVVKWLGYQQTTVETPKRLMEDLGVAQFTALCNAAGITPQSLNHEFESTRDANVTLNSILKVWYLDEVWPKRHRLAWCYRRGLVSLGVNTTGAAESNFRVIKHGASITINNKTSLRTLAERLDHQEVVRMTNITAMRDAQFSAVVHPELAPGIPAHLLGAWTKRGLALVSQMAQRAGLGGVAKYFVWEVAPQAGSDADAAWVVQQKSGTGKKLGRIRVVHRVARRMVCTCCWWEQHLTECCHCLAIHGEVTEGSTSWYWRQGTAKGVNDKHILRWGGERPLGVIAREPNPHRAARQPALPPPWRVRFGDRHAEVAGDGTIAAPSAVVTALADDPDPSAYPGGVSVSPTITNYAVGQKIEAIMASIKELASSESTDPADAAAMLVAVEQAKAVVLHIARAGRGSALHGNRLGAATAEATRRPKPGPGSNKRGKGAYG